MTKLQNYMVDVLTDKLEELKGEDIEICLCDLSFRLFESENIDGSYTYSTYKSVQWIGEYFEDIYDISEDVEMCFGNIGNPLDNPEAFQVKIMLYLADTLLYKSETFSELCECGQVILTDTILDDIIEELKEV